MSDRYKIVEGSESGHCCFEFSVIDTQNKELFEPICETYTKRHAELICNCLNYHEDCK